MNYWSASAALGRVVTFRDAYIKFVNARARGTPDEAWAAQQEMAHLGGAVVMDLESVHAAPLVLSDAPALGGRERAVDLATVCVHHEIADKYNVNPSMLVTMWQVPIGEYQRLVRREYLNLFNPVWWLAQAIGMVVRLPFYILGAVGFDQGRAEGSLVGRGYKLVAGALGFIAVPLAILSNMKNLGWLDPVANTVRHLIGQ